ncbi:MAG: type II secretion system GspH family protein [Puniceicoccales bacterium]|jgi:prepilin-type N-terminal cleavage/methylation domain-containing protein|nr:type II secretion system GspH family protein [Puniceicoccales bacterium]
MKQNNNGFTLIEVLAVIAIISILATLLTPSIGGLLERARRTRVSNNMRQIVIAYQNFVNSSGSAKELRTANRLAEWASILAHHTGMNDASLYIISEDYLAEADSRPIPKSIGNYRNGSWEMADDFSSYPLSLTVIVGISPGASPSTTPFAYTRGLDAQTGRWKKSIGPAGSVYGEKGGLVVFLDGHVEFFEFFDSKNPPFLRYDNGTPTTDIRQAVNPGAKAINWNGTAWGN